MNAPATIERPRPQRERYRWQVVNVLPGCCGEELDLRCSIMLTRDNCTAGLRHCSDEARGILHEIVRLANLYVYASMPLDALRELRRQLIMLTAAASGLEQVAFAMSGGADGGR